MAKKNLTDRFIASRKAAPRGRREEFHDAIVPGLALRVTDGGHKSFVLHGRFPLRPQVYTRRAIGDYGAITLDQARGTARDWLGLMAKGIDPKIAQQRQRALEQRKLNNSFATIAEAFLERHAAGLAKSAEAKSIINGEFVKRWGSHAAADILPEEVAGAIREIVKRGAPYQAHNAFGYLRRLFNWAIGTHEFGLTSSPVEHLRPSDLIGKREPRERVLTDDELRAVWGACDGMGYPYGPLFRLLILTGQREREVADMEWPEFDRQKKLWTIPASRMKGGRAHEVPLAPDALAIIEGLPHFKSGSFVFTTTSGEKPVNGFSKAKVRIDKISKVTGWKIHDLRRTMRTHLSALPVEDTVRELVIAHAKSGLHKVYDLHAYQDEKRSCLRLWEKRLAGVIAPKRSDVVKMSDARRKREQVRA